MKLWTVTVSDQCVVLAEDERSARLIAEKNRADLTFIADSVEPMTDIPSEWDVNAIPFSDGNNECRSIDQLIQAGFAPEYVALCERLLSAWTSRRLS